MEPPAPARERTRRLLRTLSGGRLARQLEEGSKRESGAGDESTPTVSLASRIEETLELVWPPPPEASADPEVVRELPRPAPQPQAVPPAIAEPAAEPAPPMAPLVVPRPPPPQRVPLPQPVPVPTPVPQLAPQPMALPVPEPKPAAPKPEVPAPADQDTRRPWFRRSARRLGVAGIVRTPPPRPARGEEPETEPGFDARRLVEAYTTKLESDSDAQPPPLPG
jgi:hypothetical protein